MKILITIPSFAAHGGIRIILTWAELLSQWHEVQLLNLKGEKKCTWCQLPTSVNLAEPGDLWKADCLIFTSPHSADLLNIVLPHQKCFLFLQMMEHMFIPNDLAWAGRCKKFYQSEHPMFCISQWNITELQTKFGRTGKTIYIGNGVNLKHFPLSRKPKDGRTILVEGLESAHNPTKDTDNVAAVVCAKLKTDGYRILSYGAMPLRNRQIVHDHIIKPDAFKINELYERATILIKASKYDARSCSPMEAMTKGTVTARAIIEGDDDLIHEINCLRTEYNSSSLYQASKRLLTDKHLRESLAQNCYQHLEKTSWDLWVKTINAEINK